MNNRFMNRNRSNINIIMDLERMKGEQINNISQYNHAVQRQVIQNQQRTQLLKYKNNQPLQNEYELLVARTKPYALKRYNCACD